MPIYIKPSGLLTYSPLDGGVEILDGKFAIAILEAIAGERNPDSPTNSHLIVAKDTNLTVLKTTGSAITIGAGAADDTRLRGIRIYNALIGTLTITGFEDELGAATNRIFPAATPAGYYSFQDARNSIGPLTMTLSSASDADDVEIYWRAQ